MPRRHDQYRYVTGSEAVLSVICLRKESGALEAKSALAFTPDGLWSTTNGRLLTVDRRRLTPKAFGGGAAPSDKFYGLQVTDPLNAVIPGLVPRQNLNLDTQVINRNG